MLTGASWHYSYNPTDNYYATTHDASQFVPMHWCLPLTVPLPSYANSSIILGPNEPNNLHNCNRAPADIAAAWGPFMSMWPEARLVSPATAGNGVPWLDAFFANCTHLYGAQGCRLSAVAVHDYSCTASNTLAYLQTVHDRYKLPVWLTEFSCGDGAQNKPQAQHLAYMREVLPLLDAAPYVERYAWMSAVSANRGLYDAHTGKLTPVGELFNTV